MQIKIISSFIILLFTVEFTVLQAQNVVSVYPQEYPYALKNPLKGFRGKADRVKQTNNAYTTIVRDYIKWNEIENDSTDGVQKIIDFCNARWKDYEKKNIRVIPRVYILWDKKDTKGNWPADLASGDWSSQKFKDRVVKLIYKLGIAWDNDPRVAWVQTGIIGWWGEQENPVGVDEDGWAKRLGEAYTMAFKNKKLLVRNQKVWESEGYNLGTYWDSWAHPGQPGVRNEIKERNAQGRYLTEVIEGETAYDWGKDKFSPKFGASPTLTCNSYEYSSNLIDVIKELHCTGLGWVSGYKLDGSDGSNADSVKANADRIQEAFGYNFVISQFSCSPRVDQETHLKISFKVKNEGSAPFYENWPLAFVLIDENTQEIVWKEHIKSVDIRAWHPGDNYSYETKAYQIPAKVYSIDAVITIPATIKSGNYMAGLTILEPNSQTPGIFFDIKNFLSKSQTQPLCRIGIGKDLVGSFEVNPAIFGDPVADDSRSYSLTPYNFRFSGNPLVRNHGATDPDVHVWDDTVWMYCSQDHEIIDGDTYATMDGYHVFSSKDLVNWTDHGEILHSRDVSWGVDGFMWAPGAARKKDENGNYKYYIYFPHKDKTNNWKIGVVVGDRPQGPFNDIGKPMEGTSGIDPACFIDDDGQAYLYFGSFKVAKLKPNMIELAEAPRSLDYAPQEILDDDFQRFHEGPFMHKKDGKYYFSYSNFKNNKCQGWYTMGDSPYGPFKWIGPMAPAPEGAQDHHSIIEFKGQWYYFYHIAIPNIPVNKVGQGRIACFDRLYYNNDGTMQMVVHTATPTKILKTSAIDGTISLDPPGGAYAFGTKVKLTANGNLGFAFDSWGGEFSGSANSATIVMDTDKNISASFKAIPTYNLTTKSDNGSLVLIPPGGVYNSGTDVYISPVNNFGYRFSTWGGDMFGTSVPAKINMNSNKSVIAYYTAIPTYRINGISPNGIIVCDPAGQLYEEGAVVKVKAKKDYGYKFIGWSGDLAGNSNSATLVMNSNKTITANFVATGEPKIVFATNCGGEAYRSEDGIYFEADNKFTGGGTYSTGGEISGTNDDHLHLKERNGNTFGYKIPLPNKAYKVTLMFAEIFHNSAGKRVFDVFVEGVKVSGNLDIWSKVGKNTEYNETHIVSVNDGELTIDFTTTKDNAKISAIKVEEVYEK